MFFFNDVTLDFVDHFCFVLLFPPEEIRTFNMNELSQLGFFSVLTAALNNAHTSAEHAQQSAQEAAHELASQQSMVGTAKQRVESIEEQLHAARIDFEATQHAASSAAA